MKRILMVLVAVVGCATVMTPCYGKVVKGDESKLDTLSYALGVNMGLGIKQQMGDVNFNIDVVGKAINETLAGKAKASHDESLSLLREFFANVYGERVKAHQEALKADSTAVFKAFANDAECKKISYAFGVYVGDNISKVTFPLQYYWLLQGFSESCNNDAQMTQEEVVKFLTHYFTVVVPAEAAKRSAEWLAQKESEVGVQKTGTGLLYKIIKEGKMSKAAKNDDDVVTVHYVGRLQDGTVFDASRFENRSKEQQEMLRQQQPDLFDKKGKLIKKDEPIEFPLDRVISGWTEGMKLIGPGGKIMLYIPAELAYGVRGVDSIIGPNEALEFEVELIKVSPAKKE